MILAALLTVALHYVADAETPGPPPERYERVTVTSVSPPPSFVSGFLATFVEIIGDAPGAGEVKVYASYLRVGQPYPKPGDVCDISVRYWNFSGHTAYGSVPRPIRAVERMQCGDETYEPSARQRGVTDR